MQVIKTAEEALGGTTILEEMLLCSVTPHPIYLRGRLEPIPLEITYLVPVFISKAHVAVAKLHVGP